MPYNIRENLCNTIMRIKKKKHSIIYYSDYFQVPFILNRIYGLFSEFCDVEFVVIIQNGNVLDYVTFFLRYIFFR